MPRMWIADDDLTITYEHTDASGQVIGTSIEYKATPIRDNRQTIENAARSVLGANRIYVALSAPTAAQTAAQVKALSRQNNGIIRLLLGLLDGTD